MTLVVFGATGQVARELSARAPEAVFLSRSEADLTRPAACAEAVAHHDASAVIIAAAYTAVDAAEQDEATARLVNADAPGAIAAAAADKGVPLVHISTDYVFDGSGDRPWRPDDPTGPLGAYGRTKLAGEDRVRAAGGRFAILRTSWVFSAHGGNFVKTMLRLGADHDRITIVADQIGGPTPAGDIAAATLRMAGHLAKDAEAAGTYHFSGAPDVSWATFAREIFAQAGLSVEVEDIPTSAYPTPAARPGNSRLECGALRDVFGIERPDWRTGLSAVLKQMKAI